MWLKYTHEKNVSQVSKIAVYTISTLGAGAIYYVVNFEWTKKCAERSKATRTIILNEIGIWKEIEVVQIEKEKKNKNCSTFSSKRRYEHHINMPPLATAARRHNSMLLLIFIKCLCAIVLYVRRIHNRVEWICSRADRQRWWHWTITADQMKSINA